MPSQAQSDVVPPHTPQPGIVNARGLSRRQPALRNALGPAAMRKAAFVTPDQAACLINDGVTVAITGSGGGLVEPDIVFEAVERRFLATGGAHGLTLVHGLGVGDRDRRGTNRFAHPGMVRRVIGGHWTWSPKMQAMARDEQIEAYCLPSGAISLLLREIGARRPGLITTIGLGTFVDPRQQGGRCNRSAKDDLVELIELDGQPYLRYRPFKVDVAIVRGSYADEDGNISLIDEPADLDALAVASAAKGSGGRVIVQVREKVQRGSLAPRSVAIPGSMVDAVVVCPDQAQTYRDRFEPALAGLVKAVGADEPAEPLTGVKRPIVMRAAQELTPDTVINFGFGISAAVADVIAAQGRRAEFRTTVEQGLHGGHLVTGTYFGMAINPDIIVPSTTQFDFYHGGGLHTTFLGMAELDGAGNVNVSHLDGNINGPGGFIDISQSAGKVVFCGTFDAKGAKIEIADGTMTIHAPGRIRKLVERVAAITFSGAEAIRRGQEVVYVTERAVFKLTEAGVELIELAPGVDLDTDVLPHMGFRPIIRTPGRMNADWFRA